MRFTVKAKVLSLAGGLILALAAVALIGITSLGKVNTEAENSFKTTTQPLAHLGTAGAKANENRALLVNHLISHEANDKAALEKQIKDNDALIEKDLAETAAGTIGSLVQEIQSETVRTVAVVREGADRTAEGTRTVAEARSAFARIQESVAELAARSGDIAAAAQQIRARTGEVETGIGTVAKVAESSSATAEQVSASTQETSASAEEISASAQELSATAQALEQLVRRFTV
jgi:uncharacterized phage infection (PIP) family protein YhgE